MVWEGIKNTNTHELALLTKQKKNKRGIKTEWHWHVVNTFAKKVVGVTKSQLNSSQARWAGAWATGVIGWNITRAFHLATWCALCSLYLLQVPPRRVQHEVTWQMRCEEQWWGLVIQENPIVCSFAPVSGRMQMIWRCNSLLQQHFF